MNLADIQFPGTIDDLKAAEDSAAQVSNSTQVSPGPNSGPLILQPTSDATPWRFEPCFGLDNLVDVWHLMYQNVKLYPWQYEELLRISGYLEGTLSGPRIHWTPHAPYLASYVCCNSSGKDMVLIRNHCDRPPASL